ncbi:MAG: cellulose biosynthesis cyclic di-GMP-binding regulatory protein BcsB, partial [Succinivibrio sp.]
MKNLYKILAVMFVLASVSLSFAADKDYRKANSSSKQTSQKANQQKNKLPDVIQEILLESVPADDSSVSLGTDEAENTDGRFFTNSFIQSNDATPFSQRLSFARMGAKDGIELNAGQKNSGISFTLPIDKVIISAKLELYITMTEMLKDRNIHLAVKVNGQPLGTLPIMNTELTDFEISVPAEFLSQNNSISVEIDDDEFVCKVDYSGKYKIKVDSASYIAVEGYNLELGTDLSLFPLPFYDRYNLDDAKINFVLPKGMSKDTLKAALMMASYFGSLADYRAVSFNVVYDTLPQDNSIVFAHPKQIIAGIEMPEKPGIYIKGHPYSSPYKNIYVIGANEDELIRAVYTLVNARTDTNTDYLALGNALPPVRKAYDAPNWIPSDRKVYLSELLKKNQSLVTHGYWHSALNLSFKAAPDLYQMYEDSGDLYIAYEFPLDKNIDETVSGLNLSLSGNFIEKLPVYKKGLLENIWRLSGGDAREDKRHVLIPPNIIYGDNNLEMYFDLRLKSGTPCSVISDPNVKSVIDESSYLDLSKTRHFS